VHILLQLLPHPALQRAVLRMLGSVLRVLLLLAHPDEQGLSPADAAEASSLRSAMAQTLTGGWAEITWEVRLGMHELPCQFAL